jgi:predicted permease
VKAFLEVFAANILPIFLVAAAGFGLRRRLGIDKRALSSLVFYVLSPALVFSSLVNSQLPPGELLQLAAFAVVVILLMGVVGLLSGRLLRLDRQDAIALVLVLMFVNGGNYGLTLNGLLYGAEGISRAVVYFTVSTIMVFTVGTFAASMGQSDWRVSLKRLVRLPAFYAVIVAVIVYRLLIPVPVPIMRALEIAGAGAIPVMMVVLGMQIADIGGLDGVKLALPASLLRLLVGPVIGLLVAGWIGLQGLSRSTAIIEASMPTAVIATILATEFDVRPKMVTGTVVVSTLLSAITLPLIIILLGL